MRKIVFAALFLACMAGTAYAQQQQQQDPEDMAKARDAAEIDKKYKAILELTDKGTTTKVDPWRNMRGTSSPKPQN
jgi:hypothetical protein